MSAPCDGIAAGFVPPLGLLLSAIVAVSFHRGERDLRPAATTDRASVTSAMPRGNGKGSFPGPNYLGSVYVNRIARWTKARISIRVKAGAVAGNPLPAAL